MKVTFPHMGNLHIPLSTAFRVLGAEVIVPPYSSKKTLNIGSKYSPEVICLPYKLVLGNYIEAIEKGAEAIVMIDSLGTCRLGQYSELSRRAIADLGYNVEFINIDLYKFGLMQIYINFQKVTGNKNPIDMIRAIQLLLMKIDLLDKLEDILSYYRPREIQIGDAEVRYKRALKLLDSALSVQDTQTAFDYGVKYISETRIDEDRDVLNIDITGEIFVVVDYFSNMDIERELGRLGVQVHRKIKVSDWSNTFLKPEFLRFSESHGEKSKKAAREFLKRDIGGDAIESVGDTLLASKCETDGVIHLLPFTCMPEIMSQNILHNIRAEKDIPVLSLVLDEFTGRAGFITRLEAFVDLLKRRKNKKLRSCLV